VFDEGHPTEGTVVGIVQPFLADQPECSLLDFTLMTCLAIAIGLRDGKSDGYKGSTLFDVEDCMPMRHDPEHDAMKKSPAALDLPYLDNNPMTGQELNSQEIDKLAKIAKEWDIEVLIKVLSTLKIRYDDSEAESMTPNSEGKDDGGCCITIETPLEPHAINGKLDHWNQTHRLLLPEQLIACRTRLERMHAFILDCATHHRSFSPRELVHAVDQWGKTLYEAIHRTHKFRPTIQAFFLRGCIHHIAGKYSLSDLNISTADHYDPTVRSPLMAAKQNNSPPNSWKAQLLPSSTGVENLY
jgi:hypothetical protein